MSARGRLVLATASMAIVLLASTPMARAQDVGKAVVSPREGGSSTEFVIRLPDGAECPGDSADDGYRVNSYMVPAAVAPESITFDGLGPTPPAFGDHATFREPLFDLETNSFVSAQTADAEEPGQPGLIINVPAFSFAVYSPGDVPAGRYHVGLACTLLNEITTIWDAEIEVTEASQDAPAQIRWRVLDPVRAGAEGSSIPIAAATVAAATAVALLIGRRRTPRRHATPMEDS